MLRLTVRVREVAAFDRGLVGVHVGGRSSHDEEARDGQPRGGEVRRARPAVNHRSELAVKDRLEKERHGNQIEKART